MADYSQEFNQAFPQGQAPAADNYSQEFNQAFPQGQAPAAAPAQQPQSFQPLGTTAQPSAEAPAQPINIQPFSQSDLQSLKNIKPYENTITTTENGTTATTLPPPSANIDQQTVANLNKQGLSNQNTIATEGINSNKISDATRVELGVAPTDQAENDTFKQYFPNGDIRRNPTDNSVIFKTDPNSPYVRLSPNTQQKMEAFKSALGSNDMGTRFNTVTNLIGGMIEDNPGDAAKTVVMQALTGSMGRMLISLPVGSAATGAGINAYEWARGRETNFVDSAKDDALVGLAAWMTLATVRTPEAAYRLYKGLPLFGKNLSGAQIALRENYERIKNLAIQYGTLTKEEAQSMPIMPHQMSENKLIQAVSKQISNVSELITNIVKRQSDMLAGVIGHGADQGAIASAPVEGQALDSAGKIKGQINNKISYPGTSAKDVGDTVSNELGTLADRTQVGVKGAYDLRDSLLENGKAQYGTPMNSIKVAEDVEKGIPQTTTQKVPGNILDASGKPLPVDKDVITNLQPPSPKVQSVIDDIKNWKNSPPIETQNPDGSVTTPTQQFQALQRRIYELSKPDNNGRVDIDSAQAKRLINALQTDMDNPLNKAQVGPYLNADKAARKAASDRFNLINDPLVTRGYKLNEDEMLSTPEGMLNTVSNPNGKYVTQLDRYKNLLSPDAYQGVINRIHTTLLDNPDKLPNIMDKLENTPDGREFAKRIFPDKDAQDSFKQWGNTYKSMQDLGLSTKASNVSTTPGQSLEAGKQYLNSILNGDKATIQPKMDTLANLIQNNPKSKMAEAVQSGLLQHILDGSGTKDRGVTILKADPYDKILKQYGANTQLRFLSPQYQQMLKDGQGVLHLIGNGAEDVGTSMQRGAAGSEILHAPGELIKHGKLPTEVLSFIAEHIGVGKFLSNPAISKAFYGSPLTKAGETMPNPMIEKAINAARDINTGIPSGLAKALSKFFIVTNPAIRGTNDGTTTYHKTKDQTNNVLRGQ